MRRMRRFAASLRLSAVLAGPAVLAVLAVLGLAALVSVTSAVLTTGTAPALAASGGSATLAASGNPPGDTVASVVPSTATAGSRVTFAVSCASLDATSATLFGETLGLPEQIPMEAGSADGDFVITVTLPSGIAPGTYRPDIDCSDGTSTTATLMVSTMPGRRRRPDWRRHDLDDNEHRARDRRARSDRDRRRGRRHRAPEAGRGALLRHRELVARPLPHGGAAD